MEPSTKSSLNLPHQAIYAALNCLWDKALTLNKTILKTEPNNVDALSRLGRACFELGKVEQAKKWYNQAIKIDPYNPIVLKNLKILKVWKPNGIKKPHHQMPVNPNMFLHEPGKTKVIPLLKVAEPQKLSNLYPGMEVILTSKARNISVLDLDNQYLGILPDDIAFLLSKLIKGGNKYQAIIKAVRVNGVSILIREAFRSARFKNRPTFAENGVRLQISLAPSTQMEPIEITDDEAD